MKCGEFWFGMLVGAAVGAAVAMMYAPRPGEEIRGQVAERARRFREAASERGRAALHRVREDRCESAEGASQAEEE